MPLVRNPQRYRRPTMGAISAPANLCVNGTLDGQCAFHFIRPNLTASNIRIQIVLSDAIVLFRACMIWTCNHVIRTISALLFFLLLGERLQSLRHDRYLRVLGFSGYNIYLTCASRLGTAVLCSFCSSTGAIVVAISLALNVWATAVVERKTWFARLRHHLAAIFT